MRLLTATLAPQLLLLAACSVQSDEYNTPAPQSPPASPSNPVYDSPAAYNHEIPGNPADLDPGLPVDPGASYAPPTAPPAANDTPPVNMPLVHTVEKGDTLSGLSARYKVPMDSIRRANNMKNDTVVLGRKMLIPAN